MIDNKNNIKYTYKYRYRYNGILSQSLIKQMVYDVWNIEVKDIRHLVGYDVCNYLI